MACLVINNDITSGRNLTSGQVLQLGGFTMGAHMAIEPTASPVIVQHRPCIGPEYCERMDPADVSSLNELLDRIAALGLSTAYDRIELKPDQREINLPLITHLVAVSRNEPKTLLPLS